jgi:hypothetical protein
VYQANIGNFVIRRGVTYWGPATTGVPAQQSSIGQTHTGQSFAAFRDPDVLTKDLDHIRSSVFIQDIIITTQKVCESLTVLAVTDPTVGVFSTDNISA